MTKLNPNSLCLYTDESLVALSKDGATIAYEELVKRHSAALFRFLQRLCANSAIAEELSQEAFIRAWVRIRNFDNRASFKSWVFAIGRNAFQDFLRQEKARLNRESEWAYKAENMTQTTQDQSGQLLEQILAHVPADQSAILQLFYGEEFTQSEISDTMQLPLGTVKSIINRARSKLAALLNSETL